MSDSVQPNVLATMVTTTTYGTWLPGDLRGYVEEGRILPPNPQLLKHARAMMSGNPVVFSDIQQIVVFHALKNAAAEFGYTLLDASVESWHLHWVIHHGFDPVPTMVGRLKTRMRQAINRGRIWTEGFCHRCMYQPHEIPIASHYIARHQGVRWTDGQPVERSIID